MINFASADNAAALARALSDLQKGNYDWLVVTSATTVDVIVGLGVTIAPTTRIAAVGETTAAALTLAGYRVDFVPSRDNSARGLVKEWPESEIRGRVLVPQSDIAEPNLVSGLGNLGLDVQFVAAYRTVAVRVTDTVRAEVASGRIGAVLISSGSVARQIAAQLAPVPSTTVLACIGPRTAFDARDAGLTIDVIAPHRSAESLVEALVEHATRESAPTGRS
jgi:uroporphyrinogen-III synthase